MNRRGDSAQTRAMWMSSRRVQMQRVAAILRYKYFCDLGDGEVIIAASDARVKSYQDREQNTSCRTSLQHK